MPLSSTTSPLFGAPKQSSTLRVEVLTTGDELLSGEWLDLHSRSIAAAVAELGGVVTRFNSVGDHLEELCEAISEISLRADYCVITGGLGPTEDDLTLDALSAVSQAPLSISEPLWSSLLSRYPQLGQAAQSNRRQARVIQGGEIIPNELGTAPGVKIKINRCLFMAFPGVPREAERLIERALVPWLAERLEVQPLPYHRVIRVALIGESLIAERINALPLPAGVRVGYQALGAEHRVKLSAPTLEALEQSVTLIRRAAGSSYLNDQDLSIAAQVIEVARAQGLTIGAAESCTGGQISAALTQVPGASAAFEGSVTSYSAEVKRRLLGVSEETIRAMGVFSDACASEMASGAQRALGVDWAVAVTGVAGPGGGSEECPIGTVFFGWAGPHGVSTERKRFRGDRARVQSRAVAHALFNLLGKMSQKAPQRVEAESLEEA